MSTLSRFAPLVVLSMVLCAGAASAQTTAQTTTLTAAERPAPTVLYETTGPWGWLGVWGMDLFPEQRAAARFTVPEDGDVRLVQVSLWLMNNSSVRHAPVKVTVETDAMDEGGEASMPSGTVLATWAARVQAAGWDPVQQTFPAPRLPRLTAGKHYWVVAQSQGLVTENPVWNFASEGIAMMCVSYADLTWQTCGEAAAPTLKVEVIPAR